MSDYWKKKLDELEQGTKKSSSQPYWDRKEADLINQEMQRKAFIKQKEKEKKKQDEDDDIAPVKTSGKLTKKEDDDSGLDFFQKSSVFDDGYQLGDITKTILGTAGDAGLNIVKGVTGLGEGVVDLARYGVAGVADAIGKDSYATDLRKRTQENYIDNLLKPAEEKIDRFSILGRTSDSIMQGIGQVGGIMATGGIGAAAGLGAGGVTALTTGVMGLSGMGSGMGEAYKSGATDEEAFTYGTISGAADALSELMFGGLGRAINATGFSVGLSSADDILAKKVSSLFSSQLAKNMASYGIKAGAEGFEEVVAGTAQAIGKKLTYMSEEDFGKILKDENLLEQFVVGAVTSGIAQVPGLHIANKTGKDFITGQTQNEQAVVKKEIESRIAEAEKDGKKLTAKEKAKIEAQVEKDMEKGYISTDTIEEVLGGENYQRYKKTVDSENALAEQQKALQEEFDTLNKMKQSEMTGEQIDRRAELKEELAKLKETIYSTKNHSPRELLKQRLSESVSEMVRSDRLIESYNERSRRGKAFEADLSKYDTKQQAVVQKAVESGILNNTNRTHEFVDMVAKISADKGVLFDFTNNAKLKESGFAVDGKTVNGYVTKDGITLNMDSPKAWQSTVGHEITHVLEGTDLYTELQNAVVNYAKTKGDYHGRYDSLAKLYESIEGADINAELTADLVGDYLFTDSDFINSLSTNHRNVFQKIYDEVKYLLKVVTAGSKEARELEKVKRAFDKAYRESENAHQSEEISDSNTKYSIREEAPPKNTGVAYKVFFVKDGKLYPPMVANPDGADTPMGVWLNADVGTAAPPSKTGRAQVKAGGKGTQGGGGSLAFRPGWHLGDLPRASQFDRVNPETGKKELFPENFVWAEVEYAKDVDYQEEAMSYGYTDNGKFRHAYAGLPRLPENGYYRYRTNPKPDTVPWVITGAMKVNRLLSDAEVNAILEKNGVPPVHRQGGDVGLDKFGFKDDGTVKYSLSDSDGRQLSQEQQEYFKDSTVRDKDGNLKVMYHGTSKGGFTVFDTYKSKYGLFGTGFYFTDSKNIGESYTKKGKGKNPQVYEAYLNIKNPLDMDAQADPVEWAKAFDDVDFPDSGTNEDFYRALEEYYEDQQIAKWEVEDIIRESIEYGMGYDGITHIGGGRVNPNGERHRVYIAFEPEQIKKVDNQKPTENPDIRYSLSTDSDGNKLAEEQAEYFKNSKARDAEGRLIPVYHGTFNDFNIFDLNKTSHINDLGQGHYFTSNPNDANANYASRSGGDVQTKIEDEAYGIFLEMGFTEDDLYDNDHVEDYNRAYDEAEKRFFSSPRVIKSYLNITNPLYVRNNGIFDAEGNKVFDDFDSEVKEWGVKDLGYDGIIDYTVAEKFPMQKLPDGTVHFVVFDSNQIKSVANTQPTGDPDIRYSLSDSNGKKLSAEQSEYFKDSKAVDDNGNLKVVYHGTRNADFTVFKRNVNFFTDSREMADSYSPNGDMYEGYVNITKPYEIDAAGEKWSKIPVDAATKKFLQEYGASVFKEGGKWRTTPADIASAIEEAVDNGDMDFDGIIIKNIDDTGSYYKGKDKHIATDYIVFNSNQFKNADNTKPTADKDIRFSLSNTVEETKDLMALHNLRADELLKSLDLGGLAMPSIAILKAKDGHDKYGDVSLILPKESIDPNVSTYNKVYGGDAWTPTHPRLEYKASAKVDKRISDKYYGLMDTVDRETLRPLYRYVSELESVLNSYGGEASMLESLYDDTNMMQIYLEDSGKGKVEPILIENRKEASASEKAVNEYIIDSLGEDVVSAVKTPDGESVGDYRRKFLAEHKEEIASAWEGVCRDVYNLTEEQVQNVMRDTKDVMYIRIVRAAEQYLQNGGVTVETITDHAATEKAIRAKSADGYKAWVDGLFKGAEEKTGIRNNLDMFTSSGNRRSWDALHWENTLENVVRAMRAQDQTGADAFAPTSAIFAVAHKQYGSIGEIKADSNRLGRVSEEEYKAIEGEYASRLVEIANSIKDPAERNPYIAADNAASLIIDAVRSYKTKAGMLRYMQKWNSRVTAETVNDILSLVNDIANMPTGYFEAKPQRAVGFDEVGVFVIPRNADIKLKQELLNRGYAIAEYDPDVEGDRTKVLNQFEEYKFSLSNVGEQQSPDSLSALRLDAPVAENATTASKLPASYQQVTEDSTVTEMFPDEQTPQAELDSLMQERETLESRMMDMANGGDFSELESINARYTEVSGRIAELEGEISESESDRLDSIGDEDVPPEMDAPYAGESSAAPADPFADRDMQEVGNQKVKAYQYENPEVKPYFREAALGMLDDLHRTTKGEKIFNGELYYQSGGEDGWMGTKRQTTTDIAELLDQWHYTYDQIEKGLNAIIEDDGKENNAVSKRIEFMLSDRLRDGYTGVYGEYIPPNQDYINLLNEKQINEYSREAFDSLMETADMYAPAEDDIAPVAAPVKQKTVAAEIAPVKAEYVAVMPKRKKQPKMVRADKPIDQKTANILTNEPKVEKKKPGLWSMVKENVLDNGMVFEDLALKTRNRDLQAKWNFIRYAQSMAQRMVGNGTENVKSLDSIRKEVEQSGKVQEFYEYLYHWLNVDRMTLANRYENTPNKAVFGDSVTADMSRVRAVQLGKENPEFRNWAQDVYRYNSHLRSMMVNNGVISQETADLWQEMYPHYVPIRRVDDTGLNINVPLDTGRTGVNAPVKRATGGNSDILPLFDTMAQRTMQTYKAIAKNSFGVELKNTLGTTITKEQTDIDGVIDSVDNHEGLLQEGKKGRKPTFTVFENGEKVTFEITDEMYNAMKPASDLMSYTNPVANTVSNLHRGLLTEYNPVFMATNAIKDTQDILINSQHPVKTYANLPRATWQIAKNGKWFREYMEHGGEDNTYFDGENNSFDTEEKGVRKILGIPPLSWISKLNNFVERTPRLAEYIASRESGRSIEVSMLDAARVTTNFAAGGKLTKLANRNGATFLNASVQGVVQQARNVREAKANGLKGWAQLAGKFALAGLPAVLLNNLMWDDDEEYAELSDYVKDNYYIVGKYGDGKFVRIPKGRTLAVIQSAIEQVSNAATGNDEVDLKRFLKLAISNLAPNNPVEDNILAPIIQVANNETWYGEDLVPTRLQDLPAAEQFDESTDAISKWLGEKLNFSPYKINYLLDQYSGGIGDTFLPMMTPEAESGDNSFMGNVLAPAKSKFTTDSVMNNQNVSDFYDLRDELTMNAKSSQATDKDKLMSKYINSVNSELSELYAQKRELQNSSLPANVKYEKARDIQKQIVDLIKDGMNIYQNVTNEGEYARIGDRLYTKNDEGEWQKLSAEQVTKHEVTSAAGNAPYATDGTNHYRWYEPGEDAGEGAEAGWRKVTEKELERQNEITSGLGITPEEYWGNKEEYSYAYENPESYAVAKAVGGYDSYKQYSSDLNDISADKDRYGKSISGSRKAKVLDYINSLDADYYTKLILYKSEYTSYDAENNAIIEYLNGREDISFEEEIAILRKLGFNVTAEGDISW